jgi:hypothetical protein
MAIFDRGGEEWEVPVDLLRNLETGQLRPREEVEDFFGPSSRSDPRVGRPHSRPISEPAPSSLPLRGAEPVRY